MWIQLLWFICALVVIGALIIGSLWCFLSIARYLTNKAEKNVLRNVEIESLKNGYRAINSYLTETRDRGFGSPVGKHVREMIELMADGNFDLQPTVQSVSMREGLEEQILLNHFPQKHVKLGPVLVKRC